MINLEYYDPSIHYEASDDYGCMICLWCTYPCHLGINNKKAYWCLYNLLNPEDKKEVL